MIQDGYSEFAQSVRRNAAIDVDIPNIPDVHGFKPGAVDFQPTLTWVLEQTEASFAKQTAALAKYVTSVVTFLTNRYHHSKALLLIGFMKHLPKLWLISHIPHNDHLLSRRIPNYMCHCSYIRKSAQNGLRLAMLQSLHVILFDEISLFSAEMLVVMDIVLQSVKTYGTFLGEIVMTLSGDPC